MDLEFSPGFNIYKVCDCKIFFSTALSLSFLICKLKTSVDLFHGGFVNIYLIKACKMLNMVCGI